MATTTTTTKISSLPPVLILFSLSLRFDHFIILEIVISVKSWLKVFLFCCSYTLHFQNITPTEITTNENDDDEDHF